MPPFITVVTATFNAEKYLPSLINSLRSQSDHDFNWLVVDGGSNDATLDLLNDVHDINLIINTQPDFSIYDALNRAVKLVTDEYYLVVGADDSLSVDAIYQYKLELTKSKWRPDLVAAAVDIEGNIWRPRKKMGWLYGMPGMSSSHSVGLLIKKDLHNTFGFYSNRFPIVADQYFIKQCVNRGASIRRVDFIAGKFNLDGFSSRNNISYIFEFASMQFQTEKFKLVQIALFMARLIKNGFK